MSKNPVFFVDGLTEKKVLQKLCPNKKILTTSCNGNSVKISMIAKKLSSLIKLCGNRHFPIIIVIDREGRTESTAQIKVSLEKEIRALGITDELRIGVCDRMIENWILADKDVMNKKCDYVNDGVSLDGCHGKNYMKKLIPGYHETTDGVELLSRCKPQNLYDNSPSFKEFAETIKDIGCEWLNDLKFT